jgi:hypothetical protein
MATLKDIEEAIKAFSAEEKRKLLADLPNLMDDLSPVDQDLLKIAEASFTFWDNPEDDVYDDL